MKPAQSSSLLRELYKRIEASPGWSNTEYSLGLLSLLCVIAKAAAEHSLVRDSVNDSSLSLGEVLIDVEHALKMDALTRLIKSEPSLGLTELLKSSETIFTFHEWRDILDFLMSSANSDTYESWGEELVDLANESKHLGYIGVPFNIYQLMASPLVERVIGLPGIGSALGFLAFDKKTSFEILVESKAQLHFINHLLCLTSRQGVVNIAKDVVSKTRFPCANSLSIPPWNQRCSLDGFDLPKAIGPTKALKSEALEIARLVRDRQHATVLVPAGMMHMSAYRQFREWLVSSGSLNVIVEFPARLMTNASVQLVMLEINRPLSNINGDILMIDAMPYLAEARAGRYELIVWERLADDLCLDTDLEHACKITVEQIAESDYELIPRRYLSDSSDALKAINKGKEVQNLGDVATIVRPAPLNLKKDNLDGQEMFEVLISDIDDNGVVRNGSRPHYVPDDQISRIRKFKLLPGDILLSTKGTIGKMGIAHTPLDDNLICGQTSVIIRLHADSPIKSTEYLFRYLAMPAIRNHLESLAGGSTIQFLKAKDIYNLPVPIDSIENQEAVGEIHRAILDNYQKATELRSKAIEMAENIPAFVAK